VRVDLKLFGEALPLCRNPALCVVKLARDLRVRFPSCKTSQELFLAGTYVWKAVWKTGHWRLSDSLAASDGNKVPATSSIFQMHQILKKRPGFRRRNRTRAAAALHAGGPLSAIS
jgi:hypothetical protein